MLKNKVNGYTYSPLPSLVGTCSIGWFSRLPPLLGHGDRLTGWILVCGGRILEEAAGWSEGVCILEGVSVG